MQWFIDIIKAWVLSLGYTTLTQVLAIASAVKAWVLAEAPKARVHLSSSQSIPTETWRWVQMDVKDYDTGDCYAGYAFYAPHDGHYQVNVVLLFETMLPNKFVMAAIYKEGAVHSKGRHHVAYSDIVTAVVSDIVELQAGERVEAWAYHNNGNARSILPDPAYTFFSIGEFI